MITKGTVCDFSFYVVAFDTKNHNRNYGEFANKLSLEQAKEEFAKRCAQNPMSVNTMLGVEYATKRLDLNRRGVGSMDLLQCINGHLRLSDDYKSDEVLAQETLISVNARSILEREAARLQRISDAATVKCAKLISEKIQDISSPEEAQRLMNSLAEDYGIERCKAILANELLGNREIEDGETADYLSNAFDGEYDKRFAVTAGSSEQLESLARAAMRVEASLSEAESRLYHSGLVNGDIDSIRSQSADVSAEISRHNRMEDAGLVPDDQLSL